MMSETTANNKRIVKNTLYMYFRMAVMLLLSLYTARIVFNALGVEDYGTYNIVGSIIVFFSFLNNGLGNATKRYITSEIASGTDKSRREIFNSTVIAHILIAVVILFLSETIGLWLVNNVLNIPSNRMFAANVVYQLSVFSALLGIVQGPYSSSILAYERMNIYAYFSLFDVLFKLLLVFLIQIIDGDKLIVYAFLIFVIGICNIIIYRSYCYISFPMCKWKMVKDRKLLRELFAYTSWSLFGQGAVVASNQGVSFLINVYYGVVVNAAVGVSNSVTNVVNNFVTNFQYAFNPQITKYYVAQEKSELIKLVWRSSRFSSYLVLIFLLPVCFEAKDILFLWLGDYPKYSIEFCILTMLCIYLEAITAPLWMILCSDSDIKKYQITVSSIFMLNVILSWFLLALGNAPYSVVIVRIVVNIILILTRLFLVEKKIVGFPIIKWLKDVVGTSIVSVIIPFLVTYLVSLINIVNIYLRLFYVGGVAFVITFFSIFYLGLSCEERNYIKLKVYAKVFRHLS